MTRMTRYEMKALMLERQVAMEESDVPLYPTMERVFQRLPALRADLAQAEALIELLIERPELAPLIPPEGLD
jgi:hypothetical protein